MGNIHQPFNISYFFFYVKASGTLNLTGGTTGTSGFL
jgi:hypothetical protein